MFLKKRLFILFCWCITSFAFGQSSKPILLILSESDSNSYLLINNFNQKFIDSLDLFHKINPWIDSMRQVGYLECHTEGLIKKDSSFELKLRIGPKYSYSSLDYSTIPKEILKASGFERFILNKPKLNKIECLTSLKKISSYLDEMGYPDNKVFLDSTTILPGSLKSKVKVHYGERIFIDTIEWSDPLKVSKILMHRWIGVKAGMHFSQHLVGDIQERLATQKFIEMTAPPQIVLYKNKALIKLFIKDKKVSSLDALLGLLPGTPEHPGLKLNGTFNGSFINQFRQGESILINYQSLQNSSQSLKIDFGIPYLLQLPFSPFAHFNLYKRDSLYLDVKMEAGMEWSISKHGNFKAMIGTLSSSLLKPDLALIKSTKTLPPALDLNHQYIGGTIEYINLDVPLNPKNGFSIRTMINGSNRTIKPNQAITSLHNELDTGFSYLSLYNGLLNRGFAIEWGLLAAKYTPLGRFTTWYTSIQSGYKNAAQGLQINELFRIGGYQLLRGFDEQSILAKDYFVWVNEYRLLTGALSHIYVHSDLASIYAYRTPSAYSRNVYLSFGAGMVFNTSLGLLSVSSSLGRKFPDPFDFRAIKLHVGYVSYF